MTETAPGPNPETEPGLGLMRAARAFHDAATAIEQHQGPRAGEAYEAKILAWRTAIGDIREAAKEYVKATRGD